jgi:hypothetical protein
MPYKRHTRFLRANKINSKIFHITGKKMKHKFLLSAILVLLVFGLYTPVSRSQDDGSNPTCTVTLANDKQTDATHYQFDVYLKNTSAHPFVLFNCQIGLKYTKGTNGTFTCAMLAGSSQLLAANLPFADPQVTATAINIGLDPQVTEANSTIISSTGLGTRLGTWVITSPTTFVAAKLGVTFSTGGLRTDCFAFVGGAGVDMRLNVPPLLTTAIDASFTNPVLPVELSSFASTAQGRTVVLNWSTKTEKNSDRFEVERSLVTTTTWSTVGVVKASVLSNSTKNYSYTDNKLQSGKYQYRLKMVDNNGSFVYSTVEAAEVAIPKDFAVSQNYPNPFNPTTKIDYQVPVDAKVVMEVYNITGQKVMELVNQQMSAGYYTVDFGASKLASGVYIYRLAAVDVASGKNFSSIKKMMLLK